MMYVGYKNGREFVLSLTSVKAPHEAASRNLVNAIKHKKPDRIARIA